MRQLLPTTRETVDPLDVYPTADRSGPVGRPWLMINMISSIDGAVEIDGVSGGLGGPADRDVFMAIRATADWILVAAGTARAERYGPPRLSERTRSFRVAAGRPEVPRLAIVSGSLELDTELPVFADRRPDEPRPVIITGSDPPPSRTAALREHAEIVSTTAERPTPESTLAELAGRGARIVLAEGGPTFNGQLASAGLVDEICLSISPQLVGGPSRRIIAGADVLAPASMNLAHLLEQDGMLFARYVRDRDSVE